MGNITPNHYNVFNKERIGWLNSSGMPPITTVEQSGVYHIDPLESFTKNPKGLKILKEIFPMARKTTTISNFVRRWVRILA